MRGERRRERGEGAGEERNVKLHSGLQWLVTLPGIFILAWPGLSDTDNHILNHRTTYPSQIFNTKPHTGKQAILLAESQSFRPNLLTQTEKITQLGQRYNR